MRSFGPITIPLPASQNDSAGYKASRAMLEAELAPYASARLDKSAQYEMRFTFHCRHGVRCDLLNYTKTLPDILVKMLGIDDCRQTLPRIVHEDGDERDPPCVDVEFLPYP